MCVALQAGSLHWVTSSRGPSHPRSSEGSVAHLLCAEERGSPGWARPLSTPEGYLGCSCMCAVMNRTASPVHPVRGPRAPVLRLPGTGHPWQALPARVPLRLPRPPALALTPWCPSCSRHSTDENAPSPLTHTPARASPGATDGRQGPPGRPKASGPSRSLLGTGETSSHRGNVTDPQTAEWAPGSRACSPKT